MEPDGVTKVYVSDCFNDKEVWLVYPNNVDVDKSLLGFDASPVRLRVDYKAVAIAHYRRNINGSLGDKLADYWTAVHEGTRETLDIDCMQVKTNAGRYEHLARELEKKTGIIGLTIIVS